MYYFIAKYTNMDTEKTIDRMVKVDGQFFDSERDVYGYAMMKAYDLTESNESFESIELLAC
jgi:hypothetical protein